MFYLFVVVGFCTVASVASLELKDAEEGSCRGVRYQPVPHVDLDFIDTLTYVPAAGRYHLYRTASGHPRFQQMRPFELYYNMCLTRNATYSSGLGLAIGFGGRVLASYNMRPRQTQPGVIDNIPINGIRGRKNPMTQTITLTDHKTFVFAASCWTGSDQRSWDVFSNTPILSASARRMIEQHALSLGFKREEFVFLNYNSCSDIEEDEDKHDIDDDKKSGGKQPSKNNNNLKRASNIGDIGGRRSSLTSDSGSGWSR